MSLTARRLSSAVLGLALVGGSSVAFAAGAHADKNKNITICHATGSDSNPFVVNKVDAASIFKKKGHDQHQNREDVIPPFDYIAENTGNQVTYPGLNWKNNWKVNAAGVAQQKVTKSMCTGTKPSPTPTPTPTTPSPTQTPTTTPTTTPSTPGTPTTPATPTTPVTPTSKPPTGPVVETDIVGETGPNAALIGGAGAMLLAGAGAMAAAARRRGSRS